MTYGPFAPTGEVELDVVPGAFGGKFNAQVPVSALEEALVEAPLGIDSRLLRLGGGHPRGARPW